MVAERRTGGMADPPAGEDESTAPEDGPGEEAVPAEGAEEEDASAEGPGGEPAPGGEDETESEGIEPADEEMACPECGESLPGGARFCPYCSTAIDESGDAVDVSELDGDLTEDPAQLLVEDTAGNRQAAGPVRALSGVAVSIPLAPLVLFLVGSVVDLTLWSAGLVFLGGWLLPAGVLARSRVPAEAFGRSLFLIGVCTLFVPLAVRGGDPGIVGEGAALNFEAVAGLSLVIAVLAIALGLFVTTQARKRVTGERRAFEDLPEE